MDDSQLLDHLGGIYYFLRARRGLFELMYSKPVIQIDVIKLEADSSPGKLQYTLELGFRESGEKLAYFFRHPWLLRGSEVVRKLDGAPRASPAHGIEEGGVIAKSCDHKYALNLVRGWDTYGISIVIMMPMIFSLLTSMLWVGIAVHYYGADFNTSAQTGFTIGSYVVTVGALLVALVGFFSSEKGTGMYSASAHHLSSVKEIYRRSSSTENLMREPATEPGRSARHLQEATNASQLIFRRLPSLGVSKH